MLAFKRKKKVVVTADSPQALFRDIKNRKVDGLLEHQSDMIDAYLEVMNKQNDIAFELPTGSGKTLVGLLIGEYRRRVNEEKILYLCPTKQLVNQVVEQSKEKYGIKTLAFTGSQKNFDPKAKALFKSGQVIAVSTYNGLFNTNTFFNDADIIILDDAHSAENYVPTFYSVDIDRHKHKALYLAIVELLRGVIPNQNYQRMKSETIYSDDYGWVDLIPFFKYFEVNDDLVSILDTYTEKTDLIYPWSMIRQNIHACNLFISWKKILLRPLVPPTLTYEPFSGATQRIYMSATLGNSGDLERSLGISKIHRLPIPEGWDRQGLGRRLFFFPEAMVEEDKAREISLEMIKKVDRSLILVPDEKSADEMKNLVRDKLNYIIYGAKELEASKEAFVKDKNAVAILANRFEGIDFPDDECRLLILNGLPRATHLQESFLIRRMAASVLFHDRIRTRLIQAIGRCTRGATDYSAVCILGQNVADELVPKNKIRFFHPELQAEIKFGHEESLGAESASDLLENLNIFLEHSDEWDEVDEDILSERNQRSVENNESAEKLFHSAFNEVEFVYALWKKDFDKAMVHIGEIISKLSGEEVKGYRGFWYYLASYTSWLASRNGIKSYTPKVEENLKKASQCTRSITWFNEFVPAINDNEESKKTQDLDTLLIEGLENFIDKIGISSDRKFNQHLLKIQKYLTEDNYKHFEKGHELLGELLGFQASNTEETAGPDPWWIIDNKLCIVAEDKFHQNPLKPLSPTEVKQALGHRDWIRKNIPYLDENCEIITVCVTNIECIEAAAKNFSDEIYYWHISDFNNWAFQVMEVIRKLRKRFNEPGDLIFRAEALSAYKQERLDILNIVKKIKETPLSTLTTI